MTAQCFYQLGLLAYFQANKEYIASVLCIKKNQPQSTCKGQCYLKRNLELANDNQDAVPENSEKSKLDIPVFLISEQAAPQDLSVLKSNSNFPPVKTEISGFHRAVFRPPSLMARILQS